MSPRNAFLLTMIGGALAAGPVHGQPKEVPMVRLHSQALVAASAPAVWAAMTQGRNLVTWCPVWKNAANAKVAVRKVGDVLDYTDEWGHGGRSVVTYLAPHRELRVAHEPNDGSYVCQAKLVLTPKGNETMVDYWEQYTDESPAKDKVATAAKMESEMGQTLARLKAGVEKR